MTTRLSVRSVRVFRHMSVSGGASFDTDRPTTTTTKTKRSDDDENDDTENDDDENHNDDYCGLIVILLSFFLILQSEPAIGVTETEASMFHMPNKVADNFSINPPSFCDWDCKSQFFFFFFFFFFCITVCDCYALEC